MVGALLTNISGLTEIDRSIKLSREDLYQVEFLIVMRNVIDVLKERGFIDNMTSEDARELLEQPQSVYCGFDPTSDSLHLGNMVAIMGLAWFQKCGHTPVAIVGGATGMIGDPSGKSHERQLLDEETLQKNLEGITGNLKQVLEFDCENCPLILNNYDWFKKFSYIGFLQKIGKHFRVGPMLAKDAVKTRLNSEEGMSFTEFSYQLLQGYDFLHLNQNYNVCIQLGGSDQWGNITAGTELTRKLTGKSVLGVTFPLLIKSDGQKFGKSEKGAIWLSPTKLSPYEFYQHLVRVTDADVIKLLKMLTFLDIKDIHQLEKVMAESDYRPNTAQKKLAEEVTRIVHGEEGLQKALKATAAAAPGADTVLNAEVLEAIANDFPSHTLSKSEVVDVPIMDLITKIGLQPSKGAVRRLIQSGGVYLNNQKVSDMHLIISENDLIEGKMLLIATGKKNKMLVRLG
jgi:tyrosyl-tRNA synthetase